MNSTATIFGYCPNNLQTEKAVRVSIIEIDGDSVNVDTTWLPRSICKELKVERVRNDDGTVSHEVSAKVTSWWVRKLDTRTAWQKRGEASPPMAHRPW